MTEINKGGRPPIEIDKETFEKLCALQCTREDVAEWFNCSVPTVKRWCKKAYKQTFEEVFKIYATKGRVSLRRTQFRLAEKSPAMAIFLGKQYLGQKDRIEQSFDGEDNRVVIGWEKVEPVKAVADETNNNSV